jgi:N-acetyl-gamma-glutamyl-phosphate reductase
MVRVGIVGATGYTGEELVDVLLRHPQVRITHLSAKIDGARDIADLFPRFRGRISQECKEPVLTEIKAQCDVVFLALPHTVSMGFVPLLLKAGKKVIDLSADYRLESTKVFEKFYAAKHTDPLNLKTAVYGLPEVLRSKIKSASLIANPGCYPTVSILSLAPLVALDHIDLDSIIIDAKSGVTGAGRKASMNFFFSEVNEDFKAYKINEHQHIPEINQELSRLAGKKLQVIFVPHLLPVNRGILATVYARKKRKSKDGELLALYEKFYKKEPFVRIRKSSFPQLKDVVKTNFCDIAIKDEKDSIIIVAAIDNLLKGAAGQAVQNMNILYGFPEQTALL